MGVPPSCTGVLLVRIEDVAEPRIVTNFCSPNVRLRRASPGRLGNARWSPAEAMSAFTRSLNVYLQAEATILLLPGISRPLNIRHIPTYRSRRAAKSPTVKPIIPWPGASAMAYLFYTLSFCTLVVGTRKLVLLPFITQLSPLTRRSPLPDPQSLAPLPTLPGLYLLAPPDFLHGRRRVWLHIHRL